MRVLRFILSAILLLTGLFLFFTKLELAGVIVLVIAFILFPAGRGNAKKGSSVKRGNDSHYDHTDDDDDWEDKDDHDYGHGHDDNGGSDSGGSDD